MRPEFKHTLTVLSLAWAGWSGATLVSAGEARGPADQRRPSESRESAAAGAWERALEHEATAQMEYRDLLTHYCEAQRGRDPSFACVEATDERYYLACPPDAAVMEFARDVLPRDTQPPGYAILEVLKNWSREYGHERVIAGHPVHESSVWSMSPDERRSMWRTPDGAPGISLGMVPVALQPPGDRPESHRRSIAGAHKSPDLYRPLVPPPRPLEPAPQLGMESRQPPPAPPQAQPPRPTEPIYPPPEPERGYRQPQYENPPMVREPAMVRVTFERPKKSKVKRVILSCALEEWDKDKWEDWSDKLEDELDIDDDWWKDLFDAVDEQVRGGPLQNEWVPAGKSVRYFVERY